VAARRPHRRPHRLGRPRARVPGVRVDRRRLAGRRPLRRACRADPLRRVRQLAPPRRRADVGHRRPLGGDIIKGFIVGLALTILVGQVPKLLGIEKGSGDFFEQAWDVVSNLGSIEGLTLAVGLASLAGVMGFKRFLPVVPGSLVIVLAGIAAVALLDLDDHGRAPSA
jgi:hypothetical protein